MYRCPSFKYVNSEITCFKAQAQLLHAVLNLGLAYFILWATEDDGLKLLPFESWIPLQLPGYSILLRREKVSEYIFEGVLEHRNVLPLGAVDSRVLSESSVKQLIVKTSHFYYLSVHFPALIWNDQFAVGLMGPAQGQQTNKPTSVTDKTSRCLFIYKKVSACCPSLLIPFSIQEVEINSGNLKASYNPTDTVEEVCLESTLGENE
ncbi:hypothetical protein DBR06_SOUSAS17710041 [Sousa chinensis]|nr:hypothetical protein DBR06_SOUSAS17710041 [Sousa chinensis]